MIRRYEQLKEFISTSDSDIINLRSSAVENLVNANLLQELEKLESVNKNFQQSELTLGDVRV